MDLSNYKVKYMIGNVVIVIFVVWWASILIDFGNGSFEKMYMVFIAAFQGILLGIGWRIFIIKPHEIEQIKLERTEPVSAMLIGYQPKGIFSAIASTEGNNYTKFAVYSFEWKGYEMQATADLPYAGVVRKNLPSKILVNPDNPNEIYEPEIERSRMAKYRFEASMFIFWGLMMYLFMLPEG